MDSACAINIGVNPAARCQYCGTSNAGEPPKQKGLTNVTAGQSTKYAISASDLSNAPSDPSRRYAWALGECIKKLPDCTEQDVSDAYDKLIEQSCKSAGVTMKITNAASELNAKPTKTNCTRTFTNCMDSKCGKSFDKCPTDADFNRVFTECAAEATGCDEYLSGFRESFATAREKASENREDDLQRIVNSNKSTRESTFNTTFQNCKTGAAKEKCINTMCSRHMRGGCKGDTAEQERSMAEQLCKYYDTACAVLN